jgi:hypothetical protein
MLSVNSRALGPTGIDEIDPDLSFHVLFVQVEYVSRNHVPTTSQLSLSGLLNAVCKACAFARLM